MIQNDRDSQNGTNSSFLEIIKCYSSEQNMKKM